MASAGLPDLVLAQPGPKSPDFQEIRLKVGVFDPLAGIPALSTLPNVNRYPIGIRGGYLVQFDRPIRETDRHALEQAGTSVKGYVPMMTLEVVMTETEREIVESLPGVRWVGLYQPAYKVYPPLLERFQLVFDPTSLLRLQVSLFPGEGQTALRQVRGLGAQVFHVDRGRSFEIAQVEIPSGRLEALARIPLVRYIEEVYEMIPYNDRSRFHTGLSDVADDTFSFGIDPSLDGFDENTGFQVKYGHMDTGIEIAHTDFSTAAITFEPGADSSDTDSGHGTHTAGSIVGDGGLWNTVPEDPPKSGPPPAISENRWRGVQPQAALHHISFDNQFSDREMFEREAEEGAHISSNSWGWLGFFGPITDYNTNSMVWDEGVWDADDDAQGLQPLIVFFSAGNSGMGNTADGCGSVNSDSVGSPGNAKNIITVGANETDRGVDGACGPDSVLGDNVEEMASFSSRGPVDPDSTGQGLFKPDVTNIGGFWVMSTEASETGGSGRDSPTLCSDTGPSYRYEAGTSMSCPLTVGLGGVVFQDLVVNRGIPSPKPSLIKALLINGARDLQPFNCDYSFDVTQAAIHQGWGFVQVKNSLYGPSGSPVQRNIDFENEVSANAVGTGETYQRTIIVASGAHLKMTLVWTDYPAAPGSGSPLVVNDLDLEVSGPDGVFLGNNFSGDWSITGGTPDRFNVVENVFIQNPAGGIYTITVKGFQVSQDQEPEKSGVNQDFSLVWSGNFNPCMIDANCDDGMFCNGIEFCEILPGGLNGFCRAGTPPCDDLDPCTADSCDEAAALCVNSPCNDGVFCNGEETCPDGVCLPGILTCDDGDPCTVDCDESLDRCLDTPLPDSETAAGADGLCNTADDNLLLFGDDGDCGTEDDGIGDMVCEAIDNCPDTHNPDQKDADADGLGDACDATPCLDTVTLESRQNYATSGDRTVHSLPISMPPAAGGIIELAADGDYGLASETATATVEGLVLGSVGGVGSDCISTSVTFPPMSRDVLTVLRANEVVEVEVQNSTPVDAFCSANKHTVRLEYRGAPSVSMPDDAGGVPGTSIVVPVNLGDVTGLDILSADVSIRFNAAVFEATEVSLGTLTTGFGLSFNLTRRGTVSFTVFGTTPIAGAGSLAEIIFRVVGTHSERSPLVIVAAVLNDGQVPLCRFDGLSCIEERTSEVKNLGLALIDPGSNLTSLTWSPDPAGGTLYNVYRAELSLDDFSCFLNDVSSTSAVDDDALPASGVFSYVVTAKNCRGESSLGFGTSGAERLTSNPCP